MLKAVLPAIALLFLVPGLGAAEAQSQVADANTTLEFANGLYARKMYAPAISEYEKFIVTNPQSPELASARFRVADSYYFSKNYRPAVSHFARFVADFPQDKRLGLAQFRLAAAHYYLEEMAPAIRIFLMLSKEGDDAELQSGALFYLAKAYDGKMKSEKSMEAFGELIGRFPQSEYASYAAVAIGDYHLEKDAFDRALEAYRIAAEKPEPVELAREARFKSAEIYFNQHDYVRAQDYYEKLFQEAVDAGQTATDARPMELRQKALLGLFYCDYYTQNLEAALKRYEENRELIAKSPYEHEALYLLASLQADKKNSGAALETLDRLLSLTGLKPQLKEKAVFKKASLFAEEGKKEDSLRELDKLFVETSGDKARAYYEKGAVLEQMENITEALENYKVVLSQYPATEYAKAALYQTALLQLKTNDLITAKANFSAYAAKYPSDENAEKAYLQIVQIEIDGRDFERATEATARFIKNNPKSRFLDIAYYKQGLALTGLKRHAEALTAFSRIHETSVLYPEALYGMATSLEHEGKVAEAMPYYEKITRSFPEHALAKEVLTRQVYLYIQAGDLPKASAFYQDFLLNKPQVKALPDAAFWLAQYLLDQQDYTALQKVLEVLPGRFSGEDYTHAIHFFMGESFMGQKDYTHALEYYKKAAELKPDGNYAPHAHLGAGLAQLGLGDAIAAEKNFTEALRFDQEVKVTLRARFEIASLRLKAGDLKEAAKAFMLVAILYDDAKYTPMALYKAGECFAQSGQAAEAAQAFTELKNRYPDSPWAKKAAEAAPANA